MKILQEFKDFALRGSVVDLAVGVIVGAAFGKIVDSLVTDVMMPPIGWLIGGVDFSDLQIVLKSASDPDDVVAIRVGLFLNQVFRFFIVAFAMFSVIKLFNTLMKKATKQKPPGTKKCRQCCMDIPVKAKKCPYCQSIA